VLAYLYSAILAWTQVPADCDVSPDTRACVSWVRAYHEPPETSRERFREIAGWLVYEAEVRKGPIQTALKIAAIGFEESLFARYVDSGACNRPPRRVLSCDSGAAWTPWQFHPDTLGDVFPHPLRGTDLLESRELQVRIAWDLIEKRPQAWTTLARAERRASRWMIAHPLPE
jgi:hypothetical protein